MCARSPVTWWASLSSIRSGWVWGCGPASQAVNGGVCEACSGALELSASLWAKPKDRAREGPAPRSSSPASRAELCCSSALSPNWQIWVLKKEEGSIYALHERRWEYQGALNYGPSGMRVEKDVSFQVLRPECSFDLGFIQSWWVLSSFIRWCK